VIAERRRRGGFVAGTRLARPLWLALWAGTVLLGCNAGPPALDARRAIGESTRGAAAVSARLAAAPPDAPAPLGLVATTAGSPPELVRIELAPSPSVRWRRSLSADARPELLGDVVIVPSAGELLVLDDASGQTRFELELPGPELLGAARDGATLAVVVREAEGGGEPARWHVLAFDARTGAVRFRHDSDAELGRPAARAGMLLLPWQRQGMVVLDLLTGRELSFLRSQDDVIDFVIADDDDVWFGHRTLYALSDGYDGTRATAHQLGPPGERLPGRPTAFDSAFSPRPAVPSAYGRIALHLDPQRGASGAGPSALADRVYYLFYRYVFAYDAAGVLRWARSLPRDVVTARALPWGLLTVSDDGSLVALAAADGGLHELGGVSLPLAAASLVGSAGLTPPVAPVAPAPSLRLGLLEVALDLDQRLVPARALAVSALATLPDPQATRDLLDLYARSTTPPELSRVVTDALRTRRTGLEHVIDALMARYDFLEQTRPAPLAVLAPALVEAGERRAVPRLIERMNDHETPLAVLPSVVHAVVELGDASVVPPLLAFIRLYGDDSSFAHEPDALIEAARGVLRHGGAEAPAQLGALVSDGHTRPELASALATLLAPESAGAPAEAVASVAPPPAPPLPRTLSRADVEATFRAHEDELRACLQPELERNPKLAQLRVTFVAESDGSAHAFQVTPASAPLVDCLYPKLAGYRFARFAGGRVVVRHTLALTRPADPAQALHVESAAAAPWWSRAAKTLRKTDPWLRPWWQSALPIAPLVTREPPTAASTPLPASTPAAASDPAAGAQTAPTTTPVTDDAWWVPTSPPKKR